MVAVVIILISTVHLGIGNSYGVGLETVLQHTESSITLLLKCYPGWGRTVGGGDLSNVLQQAMLPVQRHKRCRKVNSVLGPVHKKSMICAGSGKANQAGGCQGDSGGPFVCQEGGRWVLRGAVSWGHRMCTTEHFTVFARVSSYKDWIDGKMSGAIFFFSYFSFTRLIIIHFFKDADN